MSQLTFDAIAGYVYATGLRGEPAATAVAITAPESGRDPNRINNTPRTGDLSYGLWQINLYGSLGPARRNQFNLLTDSQLLSPPVNAHAMYVISSGGTNFNPWSTYKKGLHRQYLTEARAAVAAVEARNGVTGGSSSSALEAGVPGPISGEIVPPGGGLKLATLVSDTIPALQIPGADGDLHARLGIDGQVTLSVNSVTEVTLTFVEPRGTGLWRSYLVLATARFLDMDLIVSDLAWGERDGTETLTVTLQPAGVQKMREPFLAQTWNNLSPTEVMAERARAAGLRFYGKGTAQRAQIVQLDADTSATGSGRDVAESDWELGERLAQEEGFWWFEAGGAAYFAPPSWLRDSAARFPVRLGSKGLYDTVAFPDARGTVNALKYALLQSKTISLQLPRWRGEQVRPGMGLDYLGTPGFEEIHVITDVSWSLDGGVSPVAVTAVNAIDPVPQPASDDVGTGLNDGTGTAGASTTTGGISGGGRGSYGYQYDAPGPTPSGKEQPGVRKLQNHCIRLFGAKDGGIYVARNVAGTSSPSAHNEGRAGDLMVPVSGPPGTAIADYLVANASLFGVQYVIWNARSWNATKQVWKDYKAPNGKTDNTSLHRDHVHFELCWDAARNLTDAQISGAVNP